jgi:hypothetical protein
MIREVDAKNSAIFFFAQDEVVTEESSGSLCAQPAWADAVVDCVTRIRRMRPDRAVS